jgi:hypothetical protein
MQLPFEADQLVRLFESSGYQNQQSYCSVPRQYLYEPIYNGEDACYSLYARASATAVTCRLGG